MTKLKNYQMDGLPPDLIKQLSVRPREKKKTFGDQVLQVFRMNANPTLDLDTVLICLWLQTNTVHARYKVLAALRYLCQVERLFATPGKKHTWQLARPERGLQPTIHRIQK